MRSQAVISFLTVCIAKSVGVGFGIVSANVAADSGGKHQRAGIFVECIFVEQRHAVAPIGGIWRAEIGYRLGRFDIQVHRTGAVAEFEALTGGNLFGMRLGSHLHMQGRFSLSGIDFDHAIIQVAIFNGSHSGDDLHRLDISRGDAAGICSVDLSGGRTFVSCIVRQPHAVHLDCRTESRIPHFRRTAAAQRQQLRRRASQMQRPVGLTAG